LAEIPPQQAAKILARPDGRRRIADEIVTLKLVADEAQRRMNTGTGKERLTYQQALMQALTNQLAADTVGDQKFFNDHRAYFDQVKARHILVATEDSVVPGKKLSDAAAKAKAEDIKKRLDAGGDFAKIAKAESDDVASGAEGGDLGSVSRGMMVPPFEQALFALKKGQVSEPVRTPFGYHIIQLLDQVPASYDNVRPQIVQRRFELLLDDLRSKEPAELDEAYFGKKPAPATQPATKPAG
jgi:parvulin-like peptidyl-prolyl isomerase